MEFKYKGYDKKGKKIKGTISSSSRKEALQLLKSDGFRIIDLQLKQETKFEEFMSSAGSKISNSTDKLLGNRRRKKQLESLREELDFMGYTKEEISATLRGYTPDNFNIDRIKGQFSFSEIQWEKIRSGRLNSANQGKEKWSNKVDISLGVPLKELIVFTEQLSILLDTEVDIIESLETVQVNLRSKKLLKVVDKLIYDLTKGKELSASMEEHPDVFSSLYVAMVKVGENTNLAKSLDDISKFLKMRLKIKKEIVKASIYPSIVTFVMIVVMILMNFFIIPRFKDMFADLGSELPFLTQIIFSISENLVWLFGFILALGITGVLMFWKIPYTRDRARIVFDYLALRIPILKTGIITGLMYQLSLTMAITLRNGISITNSLELAHQVVNNRYIKRDISDVYYKIEKGEDIAEAFSDKRMIPPMFKSAIASGEKAGKLDTTLDRVSLYFEDELESRMANIIQFILPMSIVMLALTIAPFIVGLYLPITTMTNQIGNL